MIECQKIIDGYAVRSSDVQPDRSSDIEKLEATMRLFAAGQAGASDLDALCHNCVLKQLNEAQWLELKPMLLVKDYRKGAILATQGHLSFDQYFIIDGILKRSVANGSGKELTLRYSMEFDTEGANAAWRLHTPYPYSICAVTNARVAQLPMSHWTAFIDRHPDIKAAFEMDVMRIMTGVQRHMESLHLLDAPGRLDRLLAQRPELERRLPDRELAAYLNLAPETLSRLKHRRQRGTATSAYRAGSAEKARIDIRTEHQVFSSSSSASSSKCAAS